MTITRPLIMAVALLPVAVQAGTAVARATTEGEPYTILAARNVFGLLPILPRSPLAQLPEVPPPRITLTGTMSIFGRDQAVFRMANTPKPGQPAQESSYVLAVGEWQDGVEVLNIDREKGVVLFNNHGKQQEGKCNAAAAHRAGFGLRQRRIRHPRRGSRIRCAWHRDQRTRP